MGGAPRSSLEEGRWGRELPSAGGPEGKAPRRGGRDGKSDRPYNEVSRETSGEATRFVQESLGVTRFQTAKQTL